MSHIVVHNIPLWPSSAKHLQPALCLLVFLLPYSPMLYLSASLAPVLILLVLYSCGPHLGGSSLQQNRMTANVFALHLPSRLEIIVSVTEAHKSIPFGFGGALIPDDACLLDGRVLGERFQKGVVCDFASEVADEYAEVRRVPF